MWNQVIRQKTFTAQASIPEPRRAYDVLLDPILCLGERRVGLKEGHRTPFPFYPCLFAVYTGARSAIDMSSDLSECRLTVTWPCRSFLQTLRHVKINSFTVSIIVRFYYSQLWASDAGMHAGALRWQLRLLVTGKTTSGQNDYQRDNCSFLTSFAHVDLCLSIFMLLSVVRRVKVCVCVFCTVKCVSFVYLKMV